jgi:hypothetical protein
LHKKLKASVIKPTPLIFLKKGEKMLIDEIRTIKHTNIFYFNQEVNYYLKNNFEIYNSGALETCEYGNPKVVFWAILKRTVKNS